MTEHVKVPCNGCRACCKQAVFLFPEEGDDVTRYETKEAINPLTGLPASMIRSKANGECFYLGEKGCTIYDRLPVVCKAFDCRQWYLKFARHERRSLVAKGMLSREILDAARARLASLKTALTTGEPGPFKAGLKDV